MKYKLIAYADRELINEFKTFAEAAAALRKLSDWYFIQGPKQAWFFSDVAR